MTRRPVLHATIMMALLVPAGASAATAPATGDGTTALTLKGAAATKLAQRGVTVSAVAPAKAKGKTITLPVRTATVGTAATLGHSGGLRLRAHGRSLTLSAPSLRLGASGSRLTAKVGKATTTVLTVDAAQRKLNATAGSVALTGATVRLTAAGARAIAKALKVTRLAPGVLGTLTVDAKRASTSSGGGAGTGTTPTTGGGGTTTPGAGGGGTTTPGGGGGGTTPTPPVDLGGPAPLARPATAVDVSAASITWHVRDSFIQYINTGEGTAVSGGATADPASVQPGSATPLVYQFHFPFKAGWYDPASKTTRLTYTGTVTFSYQQHGIKLTARDPEIEINGTGSRAVFVTANTGESEKRGILVKLDPTGTFADAGTAHTWTQVPGTIPADAGESVFAGFYAANDPFGWITVAATA
jgi:hypothetical protein